MAYCTDVRASVEYTKMMVAFRATAPDHSRSRSDSARSPEADWIPGFLDPGTSSVCGLLAGRLKVLRNVWISERLISVCPAIAIFCPVPLTPAMYRGAMS